MNKFKLIVQSQRFEEYEIEASTVEEAQDALYADKKTKAVLFYTIPAKSTLRGPRPHARKFITILKMKRRIYERT